jgi:hypothetical protein
MVLKSHDEGSGSRSVAGAAVATLSERDSVEMIGRSNQRSERRVEPSYLSAVHILYPTDLSKRILDTLTGLLV